MHIFINGISVHTQQTRLDKLLQEQNLISPWLATAVNSVVVLEKDRGSFLLSDGDKIEVLSPMQGG